MNKKLFWIAALFAALALLVTGCPTGGGDDDDQKEKEEGEINLSEVFSGTTGSQSKATVTITGSTATFNFTGGELWGEIITPEEARWNASAFTGIKFEYKATGNASIFIQDTNTLFIATTDGNDGWSAINMTENWEPLTVPFSSLSNLGWFGDNAAAFDKSAIIKLCFQIADGNSSDKKFEIRNLSGY